MTRAGVDAAEGDSSQRERQASRVGDAQRKTYHARRTGQCMRQHLFRFEEEKLPLPVLLATAALVVIFVVGLLYRVGVTLLF
ncbi:hypothetical protein GCM10025298_24450 [Natronobiforma cellulositropha]